MKKIVMLLSMFLFISGCSITRIDNAKLDKVVELSMNEKITYRNAIGKGYKYYLPGSVISQSIDDYNEKLYSNDDVYYLFIDVVSYLNKVTIKGINNKQSYYYKELDNGYVDVTLDNNKYLVKVYCNYAYIEGYVKKENLNEAISNIIFILKTVKFKKNILTSGSSDDNISSYEETYVIKTEETKKVDFLDYEELYDQYTGPEIEIEINKEKTTTDLETDIITKNNVEE